MDMRDQMHNIKSQAEELMAEKLKAQGEIEKLRIQLR